MDHGQEVASGLLVARRDKTLLRAKAARTVEALTDALGPVIDAVTAQDARGWFRHCGYALN